MEDAGDHKEVQQSHFLDIHVKRFKVKITNNPYYGVVLAVKADRFFQRAFPAQLSGSFLI